MHRWDAQDAVGAAEPIDGVLVSSGSSGQAPPGGPDVVLTGGAEDLLLVLWGRRDPAVLEVEGDAALAAAWLALGGN